MGCGLLLVVVSRCCCCCCCWWWWWWLWLLWLLLLLLFCMLGLFLGRFENNSGGPKSGLCWAPPFRAKIATKNKLRLSILWRVRTSLAWAPQTSTEVLVLHGLGPVPLWFSDLALFLFLLLLLLLLLMYECFTCWGRFLGRCGIDSGGPKIGLMLEPPFRAQIATKNKLRLSILWRVKTSLSWASGTLVEEVVLHGLGPVPLWFSDLALFLFLLLFFFFLSL